MCEAIDEMVYVWNYRHISHSRRTFSVHPFCTFGQKMSGKTMIRTFSVRLLSVTWPWPICDPFLTWFFLSLFFRLFFLKTTCFPVSQLYENYTKQLRTYKLSLKEFYSLYKLILVVLIPLCVPLLSEKSFSVYAQMYDTRIPEKFMKR